MTTSEQNRLPEIKIFKLTKWLTASNILVLQDDENMVIFLQEFKTIRIIIVVC